ncbi:hypothetical protein ABNF97_12850 [Plantactinospora sp. B6F1]|uniref:hypothetical protein n=1 Tax=Plantactinospora sp. B6F1 TaxID=3158971 RepID=UPI00102BF15C
MTTPARQDQPGAEPPARQDRPRAEPPNSWPGRLLHEAVSDNWKLFRVTAMIIVITVCLGFLGILIGWLDWTKLAIVAGAGIGVMVCRTVTKVCQSRAEQLRTSDRSAGPAPRLPERDSGSEWNKFPRPH